MHDLTAEVQAVLASLSQITIPANDRIRQAVWILPLIKNPANVQLVARNMATPEIVASETSLFVEGIAAAAQRKKEITSPTIPFSEWRLLILEQAKNCPSLGALGLLSGLLLYEPFALAEPILLSTAFQLVGSLIQEEIEGTIICISWAQYHLSNETLNNLPLELLQPTLEFLYAKNYATPRLNITREYGPCSGLIRALLRRSGDITSWFGATYSVVRTAMWLYKPQLLEDYKRFLFGIVIQLQGVAERFLESPRLESELARWVIVLLQPLGQVIEETGFFENFAFVYGLSIDVIMASQPDLVEATVEDLELTCLYEFQDNEEVHLGLEIYFMGVVELLSPKLSPTFKNHIASAVMKYAVRPGPAFGASHSLLITLISESNASMYMNLVLSLFPDSLTYAQFRAAADRIVTVDNSGTLLETLFQLSSSTSPEIKLPRDDIPTLRASYASVLVHALPICCTVEQFGSWLDQVSILVGEFGSRPGSSGDASTEIRWLKNEIANVCSDLDLSLSDTGISWWFRHRYNL